MADKNRIGWEEAIKLIMQRQGKSRRQATAELVEKCREGKIPSWGIRSDTGEREPIPPDAWPKIN